MVWLYRSLFPVGGGGGGFACLKWFLPAVAGWEEGGEGVGTLGVCLCSESLVWFKLGPIEKKQPFPMCSIFWMHTVMWCSVLWRGHSRIHHSVAAPFMNPSIQAICLRCHQKMVLLKIYPAFHFLGLEPYGFISCYLTAASQHEFCSTRPFYDTFLELCKHRFVMQPLQNPPICSSTDISALNNLIFGLYWPDRVSKHCFQDYTYDIVFKMLVYKRRPLRLSSPATELAV